MQCMDASCGLQAEMGRAAGNRACAIRRAPRFVLARQRQTCRHGSCRDYCLCINISLHPPRACSDARLSASPQQSKRFTFWKSQARYRESTRREGTGVRGTHPTECAFYGAPRLRSSTQRRQPKKGFSLALRAVCHKVVLFAGQNSTIFWSK